jgi:hypothetical protein
MLAAGAVSAQTAVVNPTIVSFTASPDHNATNLDSSPAVVRYEMRVFLPTAMGTIVVAQDLGKPTPTAGQITANLGTTVIAALVKNTSYLAKVAAIGTYGEGVSDASNPFGFAAPPTKPGAPVLK